MTETRENYDEQSKEQLFNELFKSYEERMYVFIYKVFKSHETTQDLVQEIFLKLWEIRSRYEDIENMNAFIYKLAENKVYDSLRKIMADKKMKEAFLYHPTSVEKDASAIAEAKEYHYILEKAIDQLPAQRKKIYILHKKEGLKKKYIAEYLNISSNTVRNQLSSALKQISDYVKQNISIFFF